jgi:hypothetical protein
MLCAVAAPAFAQVPLDLVLILEPVEWGDSGGGALSRSAEDLRMRPDDRMAVIELIGAPKVKSKLGEGKTVVGMRWRPTFRFGATAGEPEPRARRIYDALVLAAQQFPAELEPGRQRAILLITADEEFGSKQKQASAQEAIRGSGAKLGVLIEPEPKNRRVKRGVSVGEWARGLGAYVNVLAGMDSLGASVAELRRR